MLIKVKESEYGEAYISEDVPYIIHKDGELTQGAAAIRQGKEKTACAPTQTAKARYENDSAIIAQKARECNG